MDYYGKHLGHYTDSPADRRESSLSQASSTYSYASSPSLNQHPRAVPDATSNNSRIPQMSNPMPRNNSDLAPPSLPFGTSPSSNRSSLLSLSPSASTKDISTSLSVNYLPTKFSRPHSPGIHNRRGPSKTPAPDAPGGIRGGGRDAFRAGENRMPGGDDEDYDGVQVSGWGLGRAPGKGHKPKLRWTGFKWTLFLTNLLLTSYSLLALIFTLLTWFNVWTHADVVRVGNRPELILSTIAASLGVLTALIGWAGILLNNRTFLAVYTFLTWIVFGFLVTPGYITYKRRTFNIEGKINAEWSRQLGTDGRLRIQDQLECCGYFSPFIEATISQSCYARALLPGCKSKYIKFEKLVLERWYIASFALVPLQLAAMIAALLCSNHVTYRFGKGMMPKAYRLSLNSMAVIMDNYASQLAEQYGDDVASDVVARSRNGSRPGMPGGGGGDTMSSSGYTSNRTSAYGSAYPMGTIGSGGYGAVGAQGDDAGGYGSRRS